jgi:hypothetical protein
MQKAEKESFPGFKAGVTMAAIRGDKTRGETTERQELHISRVSACSLRKKGPPEGGLDVSRDISIATKVHARKPDGHLLQAAEQRWDGR